MKQQKIIATAPDDKLNDLTVTMNIGKKRVSWRFLTNVKEDEMNAVVQNWSARTRRYTLDSLIEYINSKQDYGYSATKYEKK